jgi:hypothetical protein
MSGFRTFSAGAATCAVALAIATSAASAQPGITAPLAPPSTAAGPPPPRAPYPKARPGSHRPAVAALLSVGASGAVLIAGDRRALDHPAAAATAVIVAPAAGRWYVGQIGVLGMAIRGFGVGVLARALEGEEYRNGYLPIGVGLTLLVGGALYDVIGSGVTAHGQNQRRWAATPAAVATPGGELAPGMMVSGWF